MLPVEFEIPCDHVHTIICIVDDEELDQILNTSCENVLDPDLSTWGNLKVDRVSRVSTNHGLFALDVLELTAALHHKVVAKDPGSIHLSDSTLQPS